MISHNNSFNTNDFNFSSYDSSLLSQEEEESYDNDNDMPLIAIYVSAAVVAVICGIGIAIAIRDRRKRQIARMSSTASRNQILQKRR